MSTAVLAVHQHYFKSGQHNALMFISRNFDEIFQLSVKVVEISDHYFVAVVRFN